MPNAPPEEPLRSILDEIASGLRVRAASEAADWRAAAFTRHGAPRFVPRLRLWCFTDTDALPIAPDGPVPAFRALHQLQIDRHEAGQEGWLSVVVTVRRDDPGWTWDLDQNDVTRWRVDPEDRLRARSVLQDALAGRTGQDT